MVIGERWGELPDHVGHANEHAAVRGTGLPPTVPDYDRYASTEHGLRWANATTADQAERVKVAISVTVDLCTSSMAVCISILGTEPSP